MRHAVRCLIPSLLLVLGTRPTGARGDEMQVITIDRDDVEITRSTLVRPGTYRVADTNGDGVIHVRGAGVRLDLTGVTLDGAAAGADASKFAGIGVSIEGGKGIEIAGGAARGFRVGLRAQATAALVIEGFDGSGNRRDHLKSTPEAEEASDWLWPQENDEGQWEARYGAAISLVNCEAARVHGCSGHHGQNGLLLSGCNASAIQENDFSFNSGWGVALWRTSHAAFKGNACDFCVRGYSHGVYARGQDSAGFLVFEQCSDNLFTLNSATHSGDGFFLYAGNETLKSTGKGGSNRNMVVQNDFSHAVANGIEATFSDGNTFQANVLVDCEHAVWAGYSMNTSIQSNRIENCAHGVSIEHGTDNVVMANEFRSCRIGVQLWWDSDRDLFDSAFGRAHPDAPSARNQIGPNRFEGCRTAIRLDRDAGCIVTGNWFDDATIAIHVSGADAPPTVSGNRFGPLHADADAVAVRSDGKRAWQLGLNAWSAGPRQLAGPVAFDPHQGSDVAEPAEPPRLPGAGTNGTSDRANARFAALDRSMIFVDDWGPIEPSDVRIVGPGPRSTGAPSIYVRGPDIPFTAESLDPAFTLESTSERTPAIVHLRPTGVASASAFATYAVRVKVGEKDETFRGSTWASPWRVRFFEWLVDPREERETFATLIAGPAKDEVMTPVLDGAWPGRPTPKVRADWFATVAETKGTFATGRYRLHVTSDDGVRVLVDGKIVLEDWTWHGPKDADVAVDLAAGEHALRVEHFELDGYATLRLSVSPSP